MGLLEKHLFLFLIIVSSKSSVMDLSLKLLMLLVDKGRFREGVLRVLKHPPPPPPSIFLLYGSYRKLVEATAVIVI